MRLFSNWLPATRRFIECLLCMAVYIIIDMNVDMNQILNPAFKNEAFWYKCYTLVASMHLKMYMMFIGFAA